MKGAVENALDLLDPEESRLEIGRKRQASAARSGSENYLPLVLTGASVPEREDYCRKRGDFCRYNHREQFQNKDKMLFEQLFDLIGTERSGSDAQLTVEPRMGAGFLPSCLGLKQKIFEDKDPWLTERLSKEEIEALEREDLGNLSEKGLLPRAKNCVEYFQRKLEEEILISVPPFVWGPFSLAHLIRGDDLFKDIRRRQNFVHHLMDLSTRLFVKGSAVLKDAIGEKTNRSYHGDFYLEGNGIWSNEDTAVLLSPSQAEEFVFPYLKKAYGHFDGAVVHACGKADHLLEPLLDLPQVKGLNLGEPEKQDMSYEEIMEMIMERKKTYYGGWPKRGGESTENYFSRMLKPLEGERRGLVLSYDLSKDEDPDEIMDLWHSLQNQAV